MSRTTVVDQVATRSSSKVLLGVAYAAVLLAVPAFAMASFYPWSFLQAPDPTPQASQFGETPGGPAQPAGGDVSAATTNEDLSGWEDAARPIPSKKTNSKSMNTKTKKKKGK